MGLDFVVFFILIINVFGTSIKPKQSEECCEDYCYDTDNSRQQYDHFASKRPYNFVRGTDPEVYKVSGCEAEKIWILYRHGTRLPSSERMLSGRQLENLRNEIIALYKSNMTLPEKGQLCNEDLDLLRNWKWDNNMTGQYSEFFTSEGRTGWNEMVQLGKDVKAAFPDLVGNEYLHDNFLFRYGDFQRDEASYKAFVEGLFGLEAYDAISLDPLPEPDMLLTPYQYCEPYLQNRRTQGGPDSELAKFRNSEIYQKFRSDLKRRLGFSETVLQPINDELIYNIWEMCRFEKNWNETQSSPWCAALTESHVKLLEYDEDLSFYFTSSYGWEGSSTAACFSMKDMLHYLQSNESPKLVAYFAHIWIFNLHLTAMEAFKDAEPLASDNFDRMADRKFKTGEIVPFSANIAAVKYNCPNDNDAPLKVKFFLNQRTLELDGCVDGLSKLEDLMKRYASFNQADCNDIYCSDAKILKSQLLYFLVIFASFAIVNFIQKKNYS